MSSNSPTGVRREKLGEDFAGQRLDKVLKVFMPGVPATRIFRLLRRGEVRLNGRRASGEVRITAGDEIRIPPVRLEAPTTQTSTREPSRTLLATMQAAVLHEDAGLLVINKPAGIAVHGGSGIGFGVIEALRSARPDETLELVHRLDRDTSGCLLVARKRSSLRQMHALFRDDEETQASGGIDKRYLALLQGQWQLGHKRIDAPLRTDTRVGGERTVRVDAQGKPSCSEFKVVQYFGTAATLVEVKLLTGRTHQIRVHAAYAGHPVAGDDKYGSAEFNEWMRRFGLKRLFLHAHSIGFPDPLRQVDVSYSAPLPAELSQVIDAMSRPEGHTLRAPRAASVTPAAPLPVEPVPVQATRRYMPRRPKGPSVRARGAAAQQRRPATSAKAKTSSRAGRPLSTSAKARPSSQAGRPLSKASASRSKPSGRVSRSRRTDSRRGPRT